MVRVIDASVALKWFLLEEGRDRALTLLEELLTVPPPLRSRRCSISSWRTSSIVRPDPSPLQSELLQQVLVLGFSASP